MFNLKRLLLQLAMIKRLVAFLFSAEWASLKDSIPALKSACDDLKAFVTSIDAKLAQYRQVLEGIAQQKRDAREKLAASTYAIMSSTRSWAIKNNQLQVAKDMDVSIAELSRMAFAKLFQRASGAVTVVELHVADLADFNVTPASILAWKADIANMNTLLQGPQSAIQARKTLGKVIKDEMKTIITFVDDRLSPLMSNFLSNTEYYLGYYNNKRIGNVTEHHTRLIASVFNDVKEPQYAITVTVDEFTDPETGKHYQSQSGITNVQGTCEVSGFFPGNRTVTISGANIETKTFPAISFKLGRAITKEFIVKPSFDNIPAAAPAKEKIKALTTISLFHKKTRPVRRVFLFII